jgi:hypothetical protein
MHLPIDWLAVTLFVVWVIAVVFAFSWYRKWGGLTSNAFTATVALCLVLPVVLGLWLGSGLSPDEHLTRLLRTRVFVLSMSVRGLFLTHLVGVLTIVGMYATELRGYPRITASGHGCRCNSGSVDRPCAWCAKASWRSRRAHTATGP